MSKTICFDLRSLQIGHQNRGIGMYIKSVLEHMPKDDNNYLFYFFDGNDPIKELNIQTKLDYKIITTKQVKTVVESPKDLFHVLQLVFHRFQSLKSYKPDVVVQFDANLGMPRWRRTKKIVIGYDLIPLIMRHQYNPTVSYAWQHALGKKAKLRSLARSSYYNFRYWLTYNVYKRADHVVCISEASKESFKDLLGISEKSLASIPLAPVLPQATTVVDPNINKPYIFYIGGTDTRKRVADVVRAFNIVRGHGMDIALVLAGNEFKNISQIPDIDTRRAVVASPYISDIHAIGFVSDAEKVGLYRDASAFIFASQYEGFGLPVIEAMSLGCPVIAYNNSSIPEAAGDAAILVPTKDYITLAREIEGLQTNSSLRSKLIKSGRQQASKFSWQHYTKAFLAILEG